MFYGLHYLFTAALMARLLLDRWIVLRFKALSLLASRQKNLNLTSVNLFCRFLSILWHVGKITSTLLHFRKLLYEYSSGIGGMRNAWFQHLEATLPQY